MICWFATLTLTHYCSRFPIVRNALYMSVGKAQMRNLSRHGGTELLLLVGKSGSYHAVVQFAAKKICALLCKIGLQTHFVLTRLLGKRLQFSDWLVTVKNAISQGRKLFGDVDRVSDRSKASCFHWMSLVSCTVCAPCALQWLLTVDLGSVGEGCNTLLPHKGTRGLSQLQCRQWMLGLSCGRQRSATCKPDI